MDNFDENDDEIVGDEIIDDAMEIDDEEFFEPANIIFMNDPILSLNNTTDSSTQTSSSESAANDLSIVNFSPEQLKSINEFSIEKHSKVK